MKRIITIIALVLFISANCSTLEVYSLHKGGTPDLYICVTKNKSIADANIYVTTSKQGAALGTLIWYFTDSTFSAKKNIKFVDTPSQADLTVYVLGDKANVMWINKTKKSLLE
ncbi:MAG: DUF6150 family protein [Bacillota bacterium]